MRPSMWTTASAAAPSPVNGQYAGQGIAELLLGLPNYAGLTNLHFVHKYINGWGPFVQDTWRATTIPETCNKRRGAAPDSCAAVVYISPFAARGGGTVIAGYMTGLMPGISRMGPDLPFREGLQHQIKWRPQRT